MNKFVDDVVNYQLLLLLTMQILAFTYDQFDEHKKIIINLDNNSNLSSLTNETRLYEVQYVQDKSRCMGHMQRYHHSAKGFTRIRPR